MEPRSGYDLHTQLIFEQKTKIIKCGKKLLKQKQGNKRQKERNLTAVAFDTQKIKMIHAFKVTAENRDI